MRIQKIATALLAVSLAFGMAGCANSGKPSKEEVKAGLEKGIKELKPGTPDNVRTKLTSCVVDEAYDKLSVDALKALKTGDKSKMEGVKSADREALTNATRTCATKLVADISKSTKQ